MRFLILVVFSLGLFRVAHAKSDFEQSDAYVAAGMDLAIASRCLDELDQGDLFDAAFERFKRVAIAERNGPSLSEIEDARTALILRNTEDAEVNMFTPWFCDDLRKRIAEQ